MNNQIKTSNTQSAEDLDPSTKLWRYMDLSKFVGMVSTSSLFFSRSDLLGDQFEGTTPLFSRDKNERDRLDQLKRLRGDPISLAGYWTVGDRLDAVEISKERGRREKLRRRVFVNSWHANDHESADMWKLYKSDVGIAILSTVERLQKAIPFDINPSIAKVRYVNFEEPAEIPTQDFQFPFLVKRISFAHEREVRAIYKPQLNYSDLTNLKDFDLQENILGFSFPVKLQELISEIRVDPDSQAWSFEVVQAIVGAWKVGLPLVKSVLGSDPIY